MFRSVTIIILVFFNIFNTLSQIKGKVISVDSHALENVLVVDESSEQWGVTDENGFFILPIDKYPAKIKFSLLGKKEQILKISESSTNLIIYMIDDDFKLEEVIVTAKQNKNTLGSTILLSKKAIELVQAQSLADVMQLIPGKNIAESDLHNSQLLTLRSAIFNNNSVLNMNKGLGKLDSDQLINNSFGVGYLVNDVPLNNNLELSGNRGLIYGPFNKINDFSTVGSGVDLRNISAENIESIEVIQGISSVRYGDHNTGLIKINKKAGQTPYRIHSTLRGGAYSTQLSKGLNLPKQLGSINFELEYLHSNENPRNTLSKYDRITMNSMWEYYKKGVFKNKLSFNLAKTINGKNEENSKTVVRTKSLKTHSVRINNSTNLYFDSAYIDNLESTFSLNYSYTNTRHEQLINNGGQPIMNSLNQGTFKLGYTPVSYMSLEEVINIPISFFSRIEANKKWMTESKNIYKISFGTNIVIEDNVGQGTVYHKDRLPFLATLNPENSGGLGWRNINFNKLIPTQLRLSVYLNTESKIKVFNKTLQTEVGLRYDNYNNKSALSPRANFKFKWNTSFSTRLGLGLFVKAPALQFIHNFPSFHDFLLGDIRGNNYAFALGHTIIRHRPNNDVKPSRMYKAEIGFDYDISFLDFALTAYINKLEDGFSTVQQFEKTEVPTYKFTSYLDKEPSYEVDGKNNVALRYSKNINGISALNKGIECTLETKKITEINTSFNMSLAYRYTKTERNLPSLFVASKNPDPTSSIFIGVHKSEPTTFKTLKGSLTAVYHVSPIGLVLSLTAEEFFIATNTSYGKTIYPYAYYDKDLKYFEIPEAERKNTLYSFIRRSGNNTVGTSSYIPRMFGNYHLKVSKEFDSGLQFSFYAINFLNYLPKVEVTSIRGNKIPITLNNTISFGGNIKYRF